MICPTCSIHYRQAGTKQPIAPACAWRPTAEQLAQAAPHKVGACGAFEGDRR